MFDFDGRSNDLQYLASQKIPIHTSVHSNTICILCVSISSTDLDYSDLGQPLLVVLVFLSFAIKVVPPSYKLVYKPH